MSRRRIGPRLGPALLAVAATLVQASMVGTAQADEELSRSVSTRDLDLSKPADVARLYHRIVGAAEQVCGDAIVTGSHLPRAAQLRCVAAAVDDAVTRAHRSALTAYHRHETGDAGA